MRTLHNYLSGMTGNRRVGTAVLCPPLIPRGQTIKLFAHPTGLQDFDRFVGCADAKRHINRDRCASRCSVHPIYQFDIRPEKMQSFSDNLESLFSQSRELELEITKQLAGLVYE